MMKRSVSIIWAAGVIAVLISIGIIYWQQTELSSGDINTPPNRVKSYGTGKYVTDIRNGWSDNEGRIIESNPFTDSLSITVFLQNFDGWLLAQGRTEQRILPEDLKIEELKTY